MCGNAGQIAGVQPAEGERDVDLLGCGHGELVIIGESLPTIWKGGCLFGLYGNCFKTGGHGGRVFFRGEERKGKVARKKEALCRVKSDMLTRNQRCQILGRGGETQRERVVKWQGIAARGEKLGLASSNEKAKA